MLKCLKDDQGVNVFTVVQFLGDAIIIPAGAAHQVTKQTHNSEYFL
jgi:hypothetical protein